MYAIIQTGGKQFRVQEGDVIHVEKLAVDDGAEVNFDVLFVQDGENALIGTPMVSGATVTAKVLKQVKGQKLVIFKFKAKKNYRRKKGHRQPYTRVEILKIAI